MLNICSSLYLILAIIMTFGFTQVAEAGTCFMQKMENGKCRDIFSSNISRDDCCGSNAQFGYSAATTLNEAQLFFVMALGEGAKCTSCMESCETAKCGGTKKCVMRKGEPKCVCTPMCKVSKDREATNSNRNVNNLNNKRRRNSSFNMSDSQIAKKADYSSKPNMSSSAAQLKTAIGGEVISQRSDQNRHKSLNSDSYISDNSEMGASVTQPKQPTPRGNGVDSINSHSVSEGGGSGRTRKNRNYAIVISANNDNARNDTQLKYRHKNGKRQKHQQQQRLNATDTLMEKRIRKENQNDPFYYRNEYQQTNHQALSVCGTDGKTYNTECQLKKRACRKEDASLTVAYKGHCQTTCKYVNCVSGRYCVEDQNSMPHCVECMIKCPPFDEMARSVITNPSKLVCGADGITYRNLCEVKRAACLTGRSIPVAYRGPCQDAANCSNTKCKQKQICLTDLISHRPRCVSCSFKCPRRRRPPGLRYENVKLCGANNHTYHSWCHMMKDSCSTGLYIDVKHNGGCTANASFVR